MAVYIARAMADPPGETGLRSYQPPVVPSFPDVAADSWAYRHIEYCNAREVVRGYPEGDPPAEAVDREQMAVYVARAFGLG